MFKKKKQEAGAGLPQVHVVICRLMNDKTPVEIAEFDAVQNKDHDFNMFVEHVPTQFKEELDRKKHYIIDHLHYKLNLSGESKQIKIGKIDEKIKSIENEITQAEKNIKNDKEDQEKVNIEDLRNDLNHFKILKFTVDNEGSGSYEIINKTGKREIRFLSRDGVFHPYFYRSDMDKGSVLTMYPDLALSRKYFREVDDKITDRYLKNQDSNFFSGMKGVIITIAVALLVIANIMWASNNMQKMGEVDDRIREYREKSDGAAVDCAYYYSKIIETEMINRSIPIEATTKPTTGTTGTLVDISKTLTGQN